jgi:hypothetical protein
MNVLLDLIAQSDQWEVCGHQEGQSKETVGLNSLFQEQREWREENVFNRFEGRVGGENGRGRREG